MYYFPWVISHHISPRLYNFDWFIHSSKCYIITATQNILCRQNKRHHMLHQFESNASNYYMILEAHFIVNHFSLEYGERTTQFTNCYTDFETKHNKMDF